MSILPELIAVLFYVLYSVRDWLLLNIPLIGGVLAGIVQWIINTIPL